jgi:hypothetical protein
VNAANIAQLQQEVEVLKIEVDELKAAVLSIRFGGGGFNSARPTPQVVAPSPPEAAPTIPLIPAPLENGRQ